MKITALVENTSLSENIKSEHGLSLFIETATRKILFDAGQTDLFADNAAELSIDLSEADTAILSHGHYDHGGGLARFLEINNTAPVYVSRHAFLPCYHGEEKYIGLGPALQQSERIVFTDDVCDLGDGMTLYSCNDRTRKFDIGSFGLTVKTDSGYVPDPFIHEQYLLIEEECKRVLISGCSHKGILNIAEWFSPDVLIGGFHFSGLSLDGTLAEYAEYLNGFDTDYYTCHCTGVEQYGFMRDRMPRLHYLSAGESIRV